MGPPGGNKPPPPPQGDLQWNDERPPSSSVESQPGAHQTNVPQNILNIPQPETIGPQSVRPRTSPAVPLDVADGPQHSVNVNVQYHPQGTNSTNYPPQQPDYYGRPSMHARPEVNQVTDSTPNLLTSFIVGRMESDGYTVPPQIQRRQKTLGNNEKQIAKVLQRIGDDMSNNVELNHLIGGISVTPETAYKTFFSVASEIFQDGSINWGRIVTLFYFAYKLALQVLNQLPLFDIVIAWVTKFVAEKLAGWILGRGGWASVQEYFGATSKQLALVFIAGMALSSIFWLWKK